FETPEGYEATKQNAGSKELDSDGQVVNVKVEGSNNYTIDSGFVKAGVPNTPPTTPEEPGVPNKTLVDNKSLPDTGSETSSNVTGGLLMTILGSVLILLRGRRKESK
ncbi:TPA: LPXTG cell wall anchor domain-containing protein, partial [Staphylococcus aureus]|nr:LPXTG cell wall anchor domain-containing protein [Staphylococcus aureus]